jgi:hypothetical protein
LLGLELRRVIVRSPVYRNLDRPFQIYGFNPFELTVLSIAFAGSGELAQAFGVHRVWAFLITFILAFAIYSLRRSLGDLFARRLLRFLILPNQVRSKLFAQGAAP